MRQLYRHRISRRTFLRGAAAGSAVALALPTLEAMLGKGEALADGSALPPFFGVFFWANGLPWHAKHGGEQASANGADLWTPQGMGEGFDYGSGLLAPLARHRVSVATGLTPHTEVPTQPPGQSDGHMRGFMVAMTGDRPRPEGFDHGSHSLTALRPSIDQVVARHPDFYKGVEPRFRSLEVGVSKARFHDYGHWNAVSYNGPDSLNLPTTEPSQLYDRLFGVKLDQSETIRRARLLDAVLEDTRDLNKRLGAADRLRVEAHLEHVASLQRQLDASLATQCVDPGRPSDAGSLHDRTRLTGSLLALAIQCDLTRVFSFMLTSPASTHVFNDLGVANDLHFTCHDGQWESVRRVSQHQMEAFAILLDALATPDVTGKPLLDRGCVFGLSEYGEGWKHSVAELPALLAGGLVRGNVHTREEGGNYAKVHMTILRALSLREDSFGWHGGETSESVAGMLT